jgi:predicted amidohydrolase
MNKKSPFEKKPLATTSPQHRTEMTPDSNTLRVAALQLTSSPDPRANLDRVHQGVLDALETGAEVIALPENCFLTGDSAQAWIDQTQEYALVWKETLQEWAAEHHVWLIAGGVSQMGPKTSKTPDTKKSNSKSALTATDSKSQLRKPQPKVRNTSFMIDPDGTIVGQYHKLHLFNQKGSTESHYTEAGTKPVLAKSPWGDWGLSICYDIRFPELYRHYSQLGAKFLSIGAAFTQGTGQAHWDALTRARAIENQCFVIASALVGEPLPGKPTYGHTRIVDPWGRVLAERPKGEGVVWADLDLAALNRLRADFSVLSDRRFDSKLKLLK